MVSTSGIIDWWAGGNDGPLFIFGWVRRTTASTWVVGGVGTPSHVDHYTCGILSSVFPFRQWFDYGSTQLARSSHAARVNVHWQIEDTLTERNIRGNYEGQEARCKLHYAARVSKVFWIGMARVSDISFRRTKDNAIFLSPFHLQATSWALLRALLKKLPTTSGRQR